MFAYLIFVGGTGMVAYLMRLESEPLVNAACAIRVVWLYAPGVRTLRERAFVAQRQDP